MRHLQASTPAAASTGTPLGAVAAGAPGGGGGGGGGASKPHHAGRAVSTEQLLQACSDPSLHRGIGRHNRILHQLAWLVRNSEHAEAGIALAAAAVGGLGRGSGGGGGGDGTGAGAVAAAAAAAAAVGAGSDAKPRRGARGRARGAESAPPAPPVAAAQPSAATAAAFSSVAAMASSCFDSPPAGGAAAGGAAAGGAASGRLLLLPKAQFDMDLDDLVTFCAHPNKLLPWLGEDAADDATGAAYAPGTGTAAESAAPPPDAYATPDALPTPLMAAVPLHEHEVVCGAWRELTTALRFGRVQVPCDATRDAANDGTGGAQQPGGWQQVLDVRWVATQGRVLVALADGWLPGGGGGLFWAGSIVGRGGGRGAPSATAIARSLAGVVALRREGLISGARTSFIFFSID